MSTNGMTFVALATSAFVIFGGVLAWACVMEWLEKKRAG